MDREPPGWERQRLDGSAGKGAGSKKLSSLCLVDDGIMGWAGWAGLDGPACWRWCWCRKGVDSEGDVLSSGWLGRLGWAASSVWLSVSVCLCVWVIATGQERSPVHGAGPRLIV